MSTLKVVLFPHTSNNIGSVGNRQLAGDCLGNWQGKARSSKSDPQTKLPNDAHVGVGWLRGGLILKMFGCCVPCGYVSLLAGG